MEDRLFFSVQSRGCYAYLQNDTVDDFVRNPDGSIRMDIAMQYDGGRYSRVGFDVRAPNTFSGFVACLEKRAQEAEELLRGSTVDLRVEDNNAEGLMLIDTRTGKAMSCRALLKDYLSTFNFLSERRDNLIIYLSLPPEYDDMQKSQFIKILKTVTTARIVYSNPFYGLLIEACNPQAEFTREALGDTSVVILSLGYYFSVISVVNYQNQLSVKSSIVSTTLSIKNLIHTVSEFLVNEQLSDLARTWSEAEKAETILELMKLVLCSPTDIGQGDRVDIDFGNMPRGERRTLTITIEHFNRCAEFINELNYVIDAVLRKAGLTLNNILRFGVYSELNVHAMVSNTIARKVGQDKLSILANSGEDYLIVGLLWLQTYFGDSWVNGDSLIRNDIPPARNEPSPPLPPTGTGSPAPLVVSYLAKTESSRSGEALGATVHTPSERIGSFNRSVDREAITDDDSNASSDSDVNIIVEPEDSDIGDIVIHSDYENDPFKHSTSSPDPNLIFTNSVPSDDLVPVVINSEKTGKDLPDPSPPLYQSTSVSETSILTPPDFNPLPGIIIPPPLVIPPVNTEQSTSSVSDTIDINKIPTSFQHMSSSSAIPDPPLPPGSFAASLDS